MDKNVIFGFELYCFKNQTELANYVINTPAQYISLSAESLLTKSSLLIDIMKNNDSVLYADGAGVVLCARVIHGQKLLKLPGCEVWLEVIERTENAKVALIGAKESVLAKTKTKLVTDYNANVVFTSSGYYECEHNLIEQLVDSNPTFVFIAMGQPKQEIIAQKIRKVLPESRVMGIGGSFDVLAGSTKRAPKLFIELQLEWFYRLLCQPTRIIRQSAVFKLSFKLIFLTIRKALSHQK